MMAPATPTKPADLHLDLLRTYYPDGTNGAIYGLDGFICDTIELPWKENERGVSCIEECTIEVRPRYTKEKGDHLEIIGEPGRADCLFHCANWALTQLRGCIAPVMSFGGHGIGWNSRKALDKLLAYLKPTFDAGGRVFITISKNPSLN